MKIGTKSLRKFETAANAFAFLRKTTKEAKQ